MPSTFSNEEKAAFIDLLSEYRDKRIMILGSGFSQNLANYFSESLNLYGFRATANSHLDFLDSKCSKTFCSLLFLILGIQFG